MMMMMMMVVMVVSYEIKIAQAHQILATVLQKKQTTSDKEVKIILKFPLKKSFVKGLTGWPETFFLWSVTNSGVQYKKEMSLTSRINNSF